MKTIFFTLKLKNDTILKIPTILKTNCKSIWFAAQWYAAHFYLYPATYVNKEEDSISFTAYGNTISVENIKEIPHEEYNQLDVLFNYVKIK